MTKLKCIKCNKDASIVKGIFTKVGYCLKHYNEDQLAGLCASLIPYYVMSLPFKWLWTRIKGGQK